MAKKGRTKPISPSGKKGSSSRRPKNPAGKIKDLIGAELDIYEGVNADWDYPDEPGPWGGIITPGGHTGPVSPMDCEKWPDSPFCSGWGNAFEWGIIPSFELDSIGVSDCEILVNIKWSGFGWKQPTISIGWRRDLEKCRPPEKPDDDPENDPRPEPPPDKPPIPLPTAADYRCGFAVGLRLGLSVPNATVINIVLYLYKPVAFYSKARVMPNGYIRYDPYVLCHGLWSTRPGGYAFENEVSVDELNGSGEYQAWTPPFSYLATVRSCTTWNGYDPIFPAFRTFNGADSHYGGKGVSPSGPSDTLREINLGAFSDIGYGWSGDPNIRPLWIRSIGFEGVWYDSYINEVKANSKQLTGNNVSLTYFNSVWGQFLIRPTSTGVCLIGHGPPGNGSFPGPEEAEAEMRGDCCKAVLRKLKKIELVIAPDQFWKFDQHGNPIGRPIANIPSYFLYPDGGDKPTLISNYPGIFEAIFRMLDKNAFIPFDVEIPDVSAAQAGNQPLKLRFTNPSAALKELVQLLIDTESDVDDGNNIGVRQSYELMVMHQLLVKIYCLVEGSADYLGYEMQQKVEKVPMMFNADPTKQKKTNKQLDKNTEEAIEDLMPHLLQVSEQPVVVERNVQSKDLNETLLEILNLLQAGLGGFSQKA